MSINEHQLINKILTDKEYSYIPDNLLSKDNFVRTANEYEYLTAYYKEYNDVPDKTTFIDKFPDFKLFTVEEPIEAIVDRLREEALFRKSLSVFNKASELISVDANKGCEYLRASIKGLEPNYKIKTTGFNSSAEERLRVYKERQEHKDEQYIKLPPEFKEVQADMRGFKRGSDLWLILAKSSAGKSQVLSCFAASCANQGYVTGFISPEMDTMDINIRMDTYNGKFSNSAIEDGAPVKGYEEYLKSLIGKPDMLYTSDINDFDGEITVQKIKTFCKSKKLQILFIDGIVYVKSDHYSKGMTGTEKQGQVAQELMALSTELGIPIVCVIQARRRDSDSKNKESSEESISDSESVFGSYMVSQVATRVLSINKSKDSKAITLYSGKNRKGVDRKKYIYLYDYDHLTFTFIPNLEDASEEEKEETVKESEEFKSIF